uniref:Fungal lipase-type domain-containing protein n=1 Tax=Davidia involucrata TaxID=16924 RepID=A0A5B6YG33_DAVIN
MAVEEFSGHYLEIKPNNASLFKLVRMLFSWESGFINSPDTSNLGGFEHRCIVFLSIIVQKLLLLLQQPMAFLGTVIEMFLNFRTANGGFFHLLFNLLRGKMIWPDTTSENYKSILAYCDKRWKLDKSISVGDSKYDFALAIMAAKLTYENEAFAQKVVTEHWKMEFLGFFNCWNAFQKKYSTQAILFYDASSDLIVVAFRGTEPFNAEMWCTDIDISWHFVEGVGKIHGGFLKALGLQEDRRMPKEFDHSTDKKPYAYYVIRQKLRELLNKHKKAKFVVAGHSLGGALAILFVSVLALHEEASLLQRMDAVYTFGQPRVGDMQFGSYMMKKLGEYEIKYMRCCYCNDMVPRVPYDGQGLYFKHFGACLYYNSIYTGKLMWEEPNKNYFSLVWAIPMTLNAVWELIRGFFLPILKGSDYKEGRVQTLSRLSGLLLPGIAAHCPGDYVNSSRLGALPSFIPLTDPTTSTTATSKQD